MKVEGSVIFNKVITHNPASGNRNRDTGAFANVGVNGLAWNSAVTGTNGYGLNFHATYVNPQNSHNRAQGFPVRCVQYLLSETPMKVEGGIIFNKAITLYPASGNRNRDTGAFNNVGSYGYAWSSAVTGTNGYNLRFFSTYVSPQYSTNRANGFPVRCVQYLHFWQTF